MRTFPTLYKKTSTGAIQTWQIYVKDDWEKSAEIVTEYGQFRGKIQTSSEFVTEGKNIGKANETTVWEQARLQAQSQWEGKKKKGYVENLDDAKSGKVDDLITGGIFPMLAEKFSEQAAKITYPAYVQPKLDGHRCIAVCVDGSCTLWSRTRKPILGVPHVARAVERLFPTGSIILDGELYNHDYKDRFRELSSFIRQTTPKPGHEVVQYWVYDCVLDHEPFSSRAQSLLDIRKRKIAESDGAVFVKHPIVVVQTDQVWSEDDLMAYFDAFQKQGFEGAMVRNSAGLYINKRSYDLQKIKEFDDAEFEIVDVVPGVGKMADKGVFVCKTDAGNEFKAKMVGKLDDLKKYLDNKDDYIGEMLTVKFQGWNTKNNVPRFGVAMRLREDV